MSPFVWDDLLEYIDEGSVIVIVGSELLEVEYEGRTQRMGALAAQKLAVRLGLAQDAQAGEASLNDVVCRYLDQGGRRADVYVRLQGIMRETAVPPPLPLLELARIRHLKLFVSTTFDSLMEKALISERPNAGVNSLSYSPKRFEDISSDLKGMDQPTVYQLLGKLSSTSDYVVTDEDLLEFLCAMQDPKKRPPLLFDELQSSHLLILGCSFSDWLSRFFIRTAKGERLSLREELKVLASERVGTQNNLALFLRHFSQRTEIVGGNPADFVHQLWSRYQARHPENISPSAPASPLNDKPDATMGVFLSYASEDSAAARLLRDALDESGIDVWFDKRQLEGGDLYEKKIRQNIRDCLLFVPLISPNTELRKEGFFRYEWDLAAERSRKFAATTPFIIPVALHDVPRSHAEVPDKFQEAHWLSLPDGRPTPAFVDRILQLVRERQRKERRQS